jgi:hypothetical protein
VRRQRRALHALRPPATQKGIHKDSHSGLKCNSQCCLEPGEGILSNEENRHYRQGEKESGRALCCSPWCCSYSTVLVSL